MLHVAGTLQWIITFKSGSLQVVFFIKQELSSQSWKIYSFINHYTDSVYSNNHFNPKQLILSQNSTQRSWPSQLCYILLNTLQCSSKVMELHPAEQTQEATAGGTHQPLASCLQGSCFNYGFAFLNSVLGKRVNWNVSCVLFWLRVKISTLDCLGVRVFFGLDAERALTHWCWGAPLFLGSVLTFPWTPQLCPSVTAPWKHSAGSSLGLWWPSNRHFSLTRWSTQQQMLGNTIFSTKFIPEKPQEPALLSSHLSTSKCWGQ